MDRYAHLREHALANFELLLVHWGIEYQQINSQEYDLIAKWRDDGNFGAVRFNIVKGWGSDFAGINLKRLDFTKLGEGFSSADCYGFNESTSTSTGFDIIGLCQRVHNSNSYIEAGQQLLIDWAHVSKKPGAVTPDADAIARRKELIERKSKERVQLAQKMWKMCKNIKVQGSPGDVYLTSRGLSEAFITESNIRFHPRLINKELNKTIPALLFKVSYAPMSELVAIHRIYLAEDGRSKADVQNPKMALANIKGAAIWFGSPCEKLHIVEGPENALTVRAMGAQFVACAINATNFHNLQVPEYVTNVILCPDPDEAGEVASKKAHKEYSTSQRKKVSVLYPPSMRQVKKDWNDVWQASHD